MVVTALLNMESAIFSSMEWEMNGSFFVLIAVTAMVMSHIEQRKESR
jgi:hypothetical protein